MKKSILVLVVILSFYKGFSQNYYKEYPINISIASNGSQNRIQCSVYDSVLQTTVTFNTNWVTASIVISGNVPGKIGYTLWSNLNTQLPQCGFIIFNPFSHEFVSKELMGSLSVGTALNVICGPVWIEVITQVQLSGYYSNGRSYYRYNNLYKKWVVFSDLYDESVTADIFSLTGCGNTDRLKDLYDNYLLYYDPISDSSFKRADYLFSNIQYWNKNWEDCFIGAPDNSNFDEHYVYDPLIHDFVAHPRKNLIGDEIKGIFYTKDKDSAFKKFFFLYDVSIQAWKTDSIYSSLLGNVKIKDRVVAYTDSISGLNKKVFGLVYNPVSHSWIKDSTSVTGIVTGFQIQNGTIKWNDANGPHIRGYDSSLGWGNYNTTMFLNFHLTDFTSQGYNMIYVRNYSIGGDSIYFDFGDGVVSSNNRNALWHTYIASGTYDICIHDSMGTLSSCKQVTANICSAVGNISVANDTICEGDSTILSLSSFTGSIQWQSKIDSVWVDETASGFNTANFTVSPFQSTAYRVKVTNGTCLSEYSGSLFVKVYQHIGNYTLSDSAYTKCSNTSNQLNVVASNVTYQWQSLIANVWTNVGTYSYLYDNSATTQYRVLLKSGTCFTDTSKVIDVTIITAPGAPTTISDSICGPGNVLLEALSSSPNHYWYASTMDSVLQTGNIFTPFVYATTTYKVVAVDGPLVSAGYANKSIGSTTITNSDEKGIRFYCNTTSTLEYLYIYPQQTGNVYISLKKSGSLNTVNSYSKTVQAGNGPFKIWLNANLLENTTYDLVIYSGSVQLEVNTSGISYPLSASGNPITILGYVDSTFHSTNDYYNFYDIHITSGCKSNPVTATATFHSLFFNAIITAAGPLSFCRGDSVKLSTYFNIALNYDWKRNGLTVSNTGNIYWAHDPGLYTVVMNDIYCYDTSAAVSIRVPCIPQNHPSEKNNFDSFTVRTPQYSIYYDVGIGNVYVNADITEDEKYTITLIDQSGKELVHEKMDFIKGENNLTIPMQSFASGLYIVKMQSDKNRFIQRLMKY